MNPATARTSLGKTDKMKYLCVILDEKLTFDDHIEYICRMPVKKIGILREAGDFSDLETSILLYETLDLPHL